MSRNFRKRTFRHVRQAKIQISLRIRAVWSESSLGALYIAKAAKFLSMRTTKTRIRLRGCAGWFESSLGAHVERYVFSRCDWYVRYVKKMYIGQNTARICKGCHGKQIKAEFRFHWDSSYDSNLVCRVCIQPPAPAQAILDFPRCWLTITWFQITTAVWDLITV